jgi:hypothetical protein
MKVTLKYTLIGLFLFLSTAFYAQDYIIVGQVTNKETKEPISQANVYFKDTNIGTSTNNEGYYLLRSKATYPILVVSAVGYEKKEIRIANKAQQAIDVKLSEANTELKEIIVRPGENPAHKILRKVQENRKNNDTKTFSPSPSHVQEEYAVFISNIQRKSLNNKVFKSLLAGTLVAADSSLLLPVYASKDTYILKDKEKEILSTEENTLLLTEGKSARQLVSNIDIEVNFYDNFISLLGKNFISPLTQGGTAYYKYVLDSLTTSEGKQYEISFRPRNSKSLAFSGKMKIDSTTYALTYINVVLPSSANINYIKNLGFYQVFRKTSAQQWEYQELKTTVDFELQRNTGTKKNEYLRLLGEHKRYYRAISVEDTLVEKITPDTLQNNAAQTAIDSIKNTPIMKTMRFITDVLINKYVPIGWFDWGPFLNIYRNNSVEGDRINLGGRTGKALFPNFTIGGNIGYGFGDKQWKYAAESQYRFTKSAYEVVGIKYVDDLRRTDYDNNDFLARENTFALGDDDLTSTLLRTQSNQRLNHRKELQFFHEKEWVKGFQTRLILQSNTIYSNDFIPFMHNENEVTSFRQNAITLSTRISFGQKVLDEFFNRMYLNNKKPIINLVLEGGEVDINATQNYYLKLHAAIKHTFLVGSAGKLNYMIEAGHIWGNVPYTLLKFPRGNETYKFEKYGFNLMNYMEFASDNYVNVHLNFFTNGIIFNYIPWINTLNLREVFTAKTSIGSLRNGHTSLIDLPNFTQALTNPYVELGAGITNVFRLLTVESVWRIYNTTPAWGIRVRLYREL